MSDDIVETGGFCKHCGQQRTAVYSKVTGKAVVTLPTRCPRRQQCEGEVLPGFKPDEKPKGA